MWLSSVDDDADDDFVAPISVPNLAIKPGWTGLALARKRKKMANKQTHTNVAQSQWHNNKGEE